VRAIVEYWIATYHGTVDVPCGEDEDNDVIISRAKAKLVRTSGSGWPIGYQRFEVRERA